ncbi:MAG: hypothetical protein M3N54_04255 [Acidobacteriota bacterium]|nr:hypothetical protein [Acidobacteriota bacterium]
MLIVLCLFLQAVIRAATQSITIDEALNYSRFLNGSVSQIFLARYDANNHVLQSLLSWVSIHSMGVGELAQRVPTLAGCGLYFWAVIRLSRLLFGSGPGHLLSTVLLAGNPYVLDFFTVARGYGLALAFLSLAVVTAAELGPRPALIGVWSALSVASSLACLFPVAGLFCALAAIVYPKAIGRFLLQIVAPFVLVAGAILIIPLRTVDKNTFIFGADTWIQAIWSLLNPSFAHNQMLPLPGVWGTISGTIYRWLPYAILPGTALLIAAFALVYYRRGKRMEAVVCAFPTFTLALLCAAHILIGLRLPIMRTGIYLLFMMPLGLLAVVRTRGPVRWICLPLMTLLALAYVRQWKPAYVEEWRFDASTREFARSIEAIRAYSGRDRLKIGGSWMFGESLNYYRVVNGYTHWLPVERSEAAAPADIYLLMEPDAPVADKLKLKIITRDPRSGSVLASP